MRSFADEVIPDNVRNSVYLYNRAIEDPTGSEDIAIIKLKRPFR